MEFENFQPLGTHIGLMCDLITQTGQRQQDLAITGVKDKATVARSLAQLEEEGFVTRETDSEDRRQKLIFITPKGHRLWKYIEARMKDFIPEATQDIEPEKMATCLDVLATLYASFHQPNCNEELSSNG